LNITILVNLVTQLVMAQVGVTRCMKFVRLMVVALAFPVTWFVYHTNIIKNT
jgi:hypothetical protein